MATVSLWISSNQGELSTPVLFEVVINGYLFPYLIMYKLFHTQPAPNKGLWTKTNPLYHPIQTILYPVPLGMLWIYVSGVHTMSWLEYILPYVREFILPFVVIPFIFIVFISDAIGIVSLLANLPKIRVKTN